MKTGCQTGTESPEKAAYALFLGESSASQPDSLLKFNNCFLRRMRESPRCGCRPERCCAGSVLNDAPVCHIDDAVRDVAGEVHFMRDDEHGALSACASGTDDMPGTSLRELRIERAGRLVEAAGWPDPWRVRGRWRSRWHCPPERLQRDRRPPYPAEPDLLQQELWRAASAS